MKEATTSSNWFISLIYSTSHTYTAVQLFGNHLLKGFPNIIKKIVIVKPTSFTCQMV